MPDELLLREGTFEGFVKALEGGDFSATIAWDVPAEIDLPREVVEENIRESLRKLEELKEIGFKVLPLVKGNRLEEIRRSIEGIKALGYEEAALHASEYAWVLREDPLARSILDTYLGLLPRYFERVLLIGVLRPDVLEYVARRYRGDRRRLYYAGLSWWLAARERKAYGSGRVVDLKEKAAKLESGEVLTHRSRIDDLARHNLSYAVGKAEGLEVEVEAYDAYVELPALVVSDAHAGTIESLLEQAAELVEAVAPKTLVLLGDMFDYEKGDVSLYHAIVLFSAAEKAAELVAVRGECEVGAGLCPHRRFIETMDRMVFGDEAWTAPLEQRFRLQRFILWFYKYNRVAREEVLAITPSGTKLLFVHGHQLGPRYQSLDEVVRRARIKRGLHGAYWIILGHFHRILVDRENRIALAGAWQEATPEMEKMGFKPQIGALLTTEDEEIVVLKPPPTRRRGPSPPRTTP